MGMFFKQHSCEICIYLLIIDSEIYWSTLSDCLLSKSKQYIMEEYIVLQYNDQNKAQKLD